MGIRKVVAKAAGAALTWGLRNVARRPGGNLPGKVAVAIDPRIIAELRGKLREGSIVVVGTNGKTTVTNLLADSLESGGFSVLCNRTGANLDSGIASALLQGKPVDWGVIECDELWLAKVLPDLQATYVLLLNLFRDQLDRCGELDRIQDSIVGALCSSPNTSLIYNADDPLCAFIAKRAAEERAAAGHPLGMVAFGVDEDMNLAQNVVADATMCQVCSHMFEYDYRQYGQLGAYKCPNCGFERPQLDFVATDIELEPTGLDMDVSLRHPERSEGSPCNDHIHANLSGSYMVYNLLAIYTAASIIGCSPEAIQKAITAFNPKNGRLQEYFIDGRRTLLNLAKNPTGFNQNLRIVAADKGPHAVAFFINDQVVDGRDISWIWDIDFEELVAQHDVVVFAGGSRKNDLQVRLKYAGVKAQLIDGIEDVYSTLAVMRERGEFPADAAVYAIANYSALPPVKATLDSLEGSHIDLQKGLSQSELRSERKRPVDVSVERALSERLTFPSADQHETPIVIAHILPDLLNLYGDGGNVRILEQRLNWRGIPVEVRKVHYGESVDLSEVDFVFLGGGPDREQKLASEQIAAMKDDIAEYINDGAPLLAICGGYQILGRKWLLGDDEVAGLGILNAETRRPGTSADRLVDNIAIKTDIATLPVIGYENHAGRTYLDDGVKPFGKVVSKTGKGNNDGTSSGALSEGVMQGNVLGTYLHGTLLAKNPEVADWLLARAIERHASRTGEKPYDLVPLDDSEERAANAFMAEKLGVK